MYFMVIKRFIEKNLFICNKDEKPVLILWAFNQLIRKDGNQLQETNWSVIYCYDFELKNSFPHTCIDGDMMMCMLDLSTL